MIVRDPLFYRWSYFPRNQGQTWPAFRPRLSESLMWAAQTDNKSAGTRTYETALPKSTITGRSIRLAEHPFPEKPEEGKWHRQAVAYEWLDTYFIRLGQLRPGNFLSEQAFGGLDKWSPASTPTTVLPSTDPNPWFGEATCLLAEVDDDLDIVKLSELAEQCYASFFGAHEEVIGFAKGGVCLPFGYIAVVSGENRDDVVLLYYTSKSRVLQIVPEFALHRWFLSSIKVRHCIARHRDKSLAKEKEHEKALQASLAEAAKPGLTLRRLETFSASLSRQMVEVGDQIGEMEKDLQVMQVAARNVTHLVDDTSLWVGATRPQLAPLLLEPVVKATEQMEWDVKHLQLLLESTRSMKEHVAVVAELRRGMWERWIALILFNAVILEVFHAFHDDLHPLSLGVRLLIVVISCLGLSALALGLHYLAQYCLTRGGVHQYITEVPDKAGRSAGAEYSGEIRNL